MKPLDWDNVVIELREEMLEPCEDGHIDLTLRIGSIESTRPFVFYYEANQEDYGRWPFDPRLEKACRAAGVLTAGPEGSDFPLYQHAAHSPSPGVLCDFLDPTSLESRAALSGPHVEGRARLVSCLSTGRHAFELEKEGLADAFLIGTTQADVTQTHLNIGLGLARASLTERTSFLTKLPLLTTAANSADVCKAFVAGASGVLIHVGGPFDSTYTEESINKMIAEVASSLEERLLRLMRLARAKSLAELTSHCRIVPVAG